MHTAQAVDSEPVALKQRSVRQSQCRQVKEKDDAAVSREALASIRDTSADTAPNRTLDANECSSLGPSNETSSSSVESETGARQDVPQSSENITSIQEKEENLSDIISSQVVPDDFVGSSQVKLVNVSSRKHQEQLRSQSSDRCTTRDIALSGGQSEETWLASESGISLLVQSDKDQGGKNEDAFQDASKESGQYSAGKQRASNPEDASCDEEETNSCQDDQSVHSFDMECRESGDDTVIIMKEKLPKKKRKLKDISKGKVIAPKLHRTKADGEIHFISVGEPLKKFLECHPMVQGMYLNRGKRDLKRKFVTVARQQSAVDTGSWKRGSLVHERNRLDDAFVLTEEGMQRAEMITSGQRRDEYIVNWYLWCPGHSSCQRKCGSVGKCSPGKRAFLPLQTF